MREAIQLYDLALELENAPDLHYSKGNALRQLGKLGLAAKSFEAALTLGPDYRDAMNNLALCYRDMGHTKKALHWLEKAIAFGPDADVYRNLGSVYWITHEPIARVMKAYSQSLTLNPDPEVFDVVAGMLFEVGDIESSARLGEVGRLLKNEEIPTDDHRTQAAVDLVRDQERWAKWRKTR